MFIPTLTSWHNKLSTTKFFLPNSWILSFLSVWWLIHKGYSKVDQTIKKILVMPELSVGTTSGLSYEEIHLLTSYFYAQQQFWVVNVQTLSLNCKTIQANYSVIVSFYTQWIVNSFSLRLHYSQRYAYHYRLRCIITNSTDQLLSDKGADGNQKIPALMDLSKQVYLFTLFVWGTTLYICMIALLFGQVFSLFKKKKTSMFTVWYRLILIGKV